MWELIRLCDGKWSVRFEGEERWILPQSATLKQVPEGNRWPRIEPWQAIEIQRMLNQLAGLGEDS